MYFGGIGDEATPSPLSAPLASPSKHPRWLLENDADGHLSLDVEPGQVVHSCGSGVTACHNLFAMELAGLPGARLYPGSWSEWCADPKRPVAKGA